MNYSQFARKTALKEKDFEEIKKAVEEAETKTTGEIALALTPESSHYAFWELLISVICGCVLFAFLLPLSNQVSLWFDKIFWNVKPWYVSAFFFCVCAVMVCVMYFLFNIPAIDSLVVPFGAKNAAVNTRALRYFAESGVYCTKEHNGILIYVSYFEKQVRIVADKGISEKISDDLWNLIADEMAESISQGNIKDAYINAVKKCGDILAESFPAEGKNANELSDGLVILRNEPWE